MTADDLPAAFATLPAAWRAVLPGWTPAAERAVIDRVRAASGAREIAPADPFRAMRLVPPEAARVVVFGQDPYPKPGHADGLAFSAGHGRPHSLRRIFQVLAADRPGWIPPATWKLDAWAEQGVRLFGQCVRWALHASVRSVVIIVLAPVALLALDPPSFATAIEHWHTSTIEDQSRAVRALFAFFIGLQLLGGAMLFALTNRHSLRKRSFNRALRNAGAAIFAVDSGGGQSPRSMTHGKSFS